jgi:hypothetical protein
LQVVTVRPKSVQTKEDITSKPDSELAGAQLQKTFISFYDIKEMDACSVVL